MGNNTHTTWTWNEEFSIWSKLHDRISRKDGGFILYIAGQKHEHKGPIYATIEEAMNNSHKTAISRKKLSAPMSWLYDRSLIQGEALDFGSGRGTDADILRMDKYDPYFNDVWPTKLYDTITCQYVLNTIPNEDARLSVLINTFLLLKPSGKLFVTIRNDKALLNGWTTRGTWQGYVGDTCERAGMKIRYSCSGYQIWYVGFTPSYTG